MPIPVSEFHCIRFQYQKGTLNPPPFETMPFYLVKIRSFLKRNYGHTMWLKGNAGGERAAWLLYKAAIAYQVENLLTQPLESGGRFQVTATLEDAGEIIRRYLHREEMEVIGRMELPEASLGSKEIPHPGPREWWEKYDWKQGFFYKHIMLGGRQLHHHISADYATSHEDKKGTMLGLHNAVEVAVSYQGKDPPDLWVFSHPDKEKKPMFHIWERDALSWIQEAVTLEQAKTEEPAWLDFLDAIKIGGG